MAKSIVKNKLASQSYTMAWPCDETVAQEFATNFLEGEWSILKNTQSIGNETESGVIEALVHLKNSESKDVVIGSFYVKSSVSNDALRQKLVGKTINGIRVDEVRILKFTPVMLESKG